MQIRVKLKKLKMRTDDNLVPVVFTKTRQIVKKWS